MGELGYDILNPANHERLWIEVDWMMGVEPDYTKQDKHEPLDAIRNAFNAYSKRTDITVEKTHNTLSLPHNRSVHSLKSIKELENLHRTIEITREVFSIYIIYLNGSYSEDYSKYPTLGLAFSPSSIAIFKEQIDTVEPPIIDGKKNEKNRDLERAVLLHELGLLLGLVGSYGEPVAPHEDATHAENCADTDCLMHYSVNSTRYTYELKGVIPRDYCDDCKNDLVDILTGLKKTDVKKVRKGNQENLTLSAEFFPTFNSSGNERSVKLKYWYDGGVSGEEVMKRKDGKYTVPNFPFTSGSTLNYQIITENADGISLASSVHSVNTDQIPRAKGKKESPGFEVMELLIILNAIFVVILILRRGRKA